LFRIRATAGKKDRLGPGLAIAPQTMLDGGGELELLPWNQGACFRLRLSRA
jgi:hypothetical protein